MDECKAGIQYVFQTQNEMTLALSSTGHSGMECVMTNLIEKGDKVLIANNGIWGERAMEMARRQGKKTLVFFYLSAHEKFSMILKFFTLFLLLYLFFSSVSLFICIFAIKNFFDLL